MTDIEMVRMLSGNSEISEEFIAFYLDSTRQFILAYCNIKEIPEALHATFVEIASLRVKANSSGSASALGEGLKSVGSLSDGNQSVSYQTSASSGKQFTSEEDIVSAYGTILDRFRRMDVDKPRFLRSPGSRCIHRHSNDVGW